MDVSIETSMGRYRAMSGSNKIKFQSGQSYSYIMRKVWCDQIWIQTYIGFIVLILRPTHQFINFFSLMEFKSIKKVTKNLAHGIRNHKNKKISGQIVLKTDQK